MSPHHEARSGGLEESLLLEQSPELTAPRRLRTAWQLRVLAGVALVGLGAGAAGLVWVPWQQSVVGTGRVIVLSPMQRPQGIEAPIKARLAHWYVQEGQVVAEGERIADLAEVDSKFLDQDQPRRLRAQRDALADQVEAGLARIRALEAQIESLETYRVASIRADGQKIRQAEQKIAQEQEARRAAEQDLTTARLNLDRLASLHDSGIRSKRDLELAQLSRVKAETDLAKATAAVEVATQGRQVAVLEQEKTAADLAAKLSSTRAYLAEAREKVAKTRSDAQKLAIELANLEARVAQRQVRAPIAGRVVRLLKVGAGETVKEGDVLALLAPDTPDRSVEMFVSGSDAPLVSPGRHVRLQFDGWPAIQFSGWPSVAVGTFGGRVAVVDAVDDGRGKFRVLVVPGGDPAWPDPSYLRPGARVSGWIMLDVVPLGFELWRQFNGFAPTLKDGPQGAPSGKGPKDE